MDHYDHVALIVQRYNNGCIPDGPVEARYSRVLMDVPDEHRFAYFEKQVGAMDPDLVLLAVVEDSGHDHPEVITAEGLQPNGDAAHMP